MADRRFGITVEVTDKGIHVFDAAGKKIDALTNKVSAFGFELGKETKATDAFGFSLNNMGGAAATTAGKFDGLVAQQAKFTNAWDPAKAKVDAFGFSTVKLEKHVSDVGYTLGHKIPDAATKAGAGLGGVATKIGLATTAMRGLQVVGVEIPPGLTQLGSVAQSATTKLMSMGGAAGATGTAFTALKAGATAAGGAAVTVATSAAAAALSVGTMFYQVGKLATVSKEFADENLDATFFQAASATLGFTHELDVNREAMLRVREEANRGTAQTDQQARIAEKMGITYEEVARKFGDNILKWKEGAKVNDDLKRALLAVSAEEVKAIDVKVQLAKVEKDLAQQVREVTEANKKRDANLQFIGESAAKRIGEESRLMNESSNAALKTFDDLKAKMAALPENFKTVSEAVGSTQIAARMLAPEFERIHAAAKEAGMVIPQSFTAAKQAIDIAKVSAEEYLAKMKEINAERVRERDERHKERAEQESAQTKFEKSQGKVESGDFTKISQTFGLADASNPFADQAGTKFDPSDPRIRQALAAAYAQATPDKLGGFLSGQVREALKVALSGDMEMLAKVAALLKGQAGSLSSGNITDFGIAAGGSRAGAAAASLESVINQLRGIIGRAGGGSVMGRQPYMVGERGPEVFVPSSGGHIISNADLRQLMAGNSQPIVIHVSSLLDGKEVARNTVFHERRGQAGGIR